MPAFKFNEEVTAVFDDMIKRSVPFYMESIKRQCEMAHRFYQPGSRIYDLGCSHGNLGIMLHALTPMPYNMVAIDSSPSMLQKYRNRFSKIDIGKSNTHLICCLAEDIRISYSSVVIVNLTMQFIKPAKRDLFIKKIYDGMLPGGILLLSEKVIHEKNSISNLQQDFYKKFKLENGYSELEISRKRDSLENILIPETIESQTERLEKYGFKQIDVWLKWFNFASLIAIKE